MRTDNFKVMKDNIISKFSDVFRDELGEKPMKGPPVHVHLKPGSVPYRVSIARTIPLRFIEPANTTIEELISKNIIVRCSEPTEWCSPAFFVVKGDGKSVRMVTDFIRLNEHVHRPEHPFPCVSEILKTIPSTAKYFAKFDAVNGYFQIALDEESSKLTTFILPSGRYRYLRLPQGLNASSDEWCRRSDVIVEGLTYAKKIVDDVLIWASTPQELIQRAETIAERCRDMNIVLSKKKLCFGTSMSFAGYIVSDKGVGPDPARVEALKKFPVPKDQTGVRSFMGLANQLSFFIPDFAQMTPSLRALQGKGVPFLWLPEHQCEFETVKNVLTVNMLNRHFDARKPVFLLTDASRLNGLGFALCQKDDEGHLVIITCGSKSLTESQSRYATVELECLAIVWGVAKCDFYLRGLPMFTVVTDHKPLVGVFSHGLADQVNPRLQRFREKLTPYRFQVKWIQGKNHFIADALSRAPVFAPEEEPDMQVDTALSCMIMTKDPALESITSMVDEDYESGISDIIYDKHKSEILKHLKQLRERLSVSDDGKLLLLDGVRIIVPKSAIPSILKRMHAGHPGQEKSLKLAQALFYWPGMNNEIRNFVSTCKHCFRQLPSQVANPVSTSPPSENYGPPMSQIGLDLFEFDKKQYFHYTDY